MISIPYSTARRIVSDKTILNDTFPKPVRDAARATRQAAIKEKKQAYVQAYVSYSYITGKYSLNSDNYYGQEIYKNQQRIDNAKKEFDTKLGKKEWELVELRAGCVTDTVDYPLEVKNPTFGLSASAVGQLVIRNKKSKELVELPWLSLGAWIRGRAFCALRCLYFLTDYVDGATNLWDAVRAAFERLVQEQGAKMK